MKKLDCFEASHLQIGDHGLYTVRNPDDVIDFDARGADKNLINLVIRRGAMNTSAGSIRNALNSRSVTSQCVGAEDTAIKPAEANGYADSVAVKVGRFLVTPSSGDVPMEDDSREVTASLGAPAACEAGAGYDDVSDDDVDSQGSVQLEEANTQKKRQARRKIARGFKVKKLRRAPRKDSGDAPLKAGDVVPVEVISTISSAEVMWQVQAIQSFMYTTSCFSWLFTFQDGSIENVFSTDLFPIHHLDEQEFFPADFVMRNG